MALEDGYVDLGVGLANPVGLICPNPGVCLTTFRCDFLGPISRDASFSFRSSSACVRSADSIIACIMGDCTTR